MRGVWGVILVLMLLGGELQAGEPGTREGLPGVPSPFAQTDESPTKLLPGLELDLKVEPDGATNVQLRQGEATLSNPHGEVQLRPGEQGYAEPGKPPRIQATPRP